MAVSGDAGVFSADTLVMAAPGVSHDKVLEELVGLIAGKLTASAVSLPRDALPKAVERVLSKIEAAEVLKGSKETLGRRMLSLLAEDEVGAPHAQVFADAQADRALTYEMGRMIFELRRKDVETSVASEPPPPPPPPPAAAPEPVAVVEPPRAPEPPPAAPASPSIEDQKAGIIRRLSDFIEAEADPFDPEKRPALESAIGRALERGARGVDPEKFDPSEFATTLIDNLCQESSLNLSAKQRAALTDALGQNNFVRALSLPISEFFKILPARRTVQEPDGLLGHEQHLTPPNGIHTLGSELDRELTEEGHHDPLLPDAPEPAAGKEPEEHRREDSGSTPAVVPLPPRDSKDFAAIRFHINREWPRILRAAAQNPGRVDLSLPLAPGQPALSLTIAHAQNMALLNLSLPVPTGNAGVETSRFVLRLFDELGSQLRNNSSQMLKSPETARVPAALRPLQAAKSGNLSLVLVAPRDMQNLQLFRLLKDNMLGALGAVETAPPALPGFK